MLGEQLDVWNIHKTPIDWDFVHKNYSQVIIGGAGLLHSVFEKFWIDIEKNCKLPIIIWGIGVCLPDNDSVKGVPKQVVQSVFAKAKFANVRDELTRDFYELDPNISITACPTLVYISNSFKVEAKTKSGNHILHSSHVDLEPISSITARASKKDRSEATALVPTNANNPTASAISVATGTPQPFASTSPAMIK
jgi:hypothetical protein